MELPDIQQAVAQAIVRVESFASIISKMSIVLRNNTSYHTTLESAATGPEAKIGDLAAEEISLI